jgi:hypothetical protein
MEIMSHRRLTSPALLLLLAASPALAQPADDPFEAIVANPDGANAALNDTAIPIRNPTEDELRQYLEAFRAINLDATLTVDPDARKPKLGPFSVAAGSDVRLSAGFTKANGEREAVLRTLELVPSSPMKMGPLRFNKMTLDRNGVLRFKLNLNLMGVNFWPQEMTIEKIYRDRDGNLVFKTGGSGLAGAFGPDLRITPQGKVQRYKKPFLGFIGGGWKDVKEGGKPVVVAETIPLDRWPPGATDILKWLPQPAVNAYPAGMDREALAPIVEAVPVSALNVRFTADADPRRITLSNGEGHLDISNHHLDYEANGRFEGRTYVSDPTKRNAYTATARVTGEVDRPGVGRATIDGLDVELTGEHSGSIPFEDPSRIDIEGTLRAKVRGSVSDARLGLPGGPTIHAPGTTRFEFDGDGSAILRPFSEDEAERKEIVISRDSRYSFSTEGPVEIEGLSTTMPGNVSVPDRMRVVAADDPSTPDVDESLGPVLTGEGDMGTKLGFHVARTRLNINGELESGGLISVIEDTDAGRVALRSNLEPGSVMNMRGYVFAGFKADGSGGGARMSTDTRLRGTGTNTRVEANGMTVDMPGATDVDARVAANVRHGTANGAETVVRELAARGSVRLREGEGTVSGGLPGQPSINGRIAAGSNLEFDTGRLLRVNPRTTVMETSGYEDGERGAKVRAHLILEGGSIAHNDLAVAFRGRTEIDLNAALGFRFDPGAAAANGAQPGDPLLTTLDLGLRFAPGSQLKLNQTSGDASTFNLRGSTVFTAHVEAEIAADGTATLGALNGIDLTIEADAIDMKMILGPNNAVTANVGSRTTVRLKNASLELLTGGGMRIHHNGISIEVAAGTIDIGTRR